MGNLTEKQAQRAFGRKVKKKHKTSRLIKYKNMEANPKKTSPKWANLHKNTTKFCFAVNWKSKMAMKFDKKVMRNTEISKNQAQKASKFYSKQAQIQATHKP